MIGYRFRVCGLLLLCGWTLLAPAQDCAITPARTSTNPVTLGNGNPGSISRADIQAALDNGGFIILFQGPNPSTISLDQPLVISREVTLDGGGLITLSGGDSTRVLSIDRPNVGGYRATVQNLAIVDGNVPSGDGAGIGTVDDTGVWQSIDLEIINVDFRGNDAIQTAQDGGGGAVYGRGLQSLLIHDSTFDNNSGSNGGAIYTLGTSKLRITDSLITNNRATGTGGNPGSGGNAGAIGVDGRERVVDICRSRIQGNRGNARGIGFFSVFYDALSETNFVDVTFLNNRVNTTSNNRQYQGGGAYLQTQGDQPLGRVLMERVSFINNRAEAAGGAFLNNISATLVNTTFFGNIAYESLGGALVIDSNSVIDLRHATIANNSAPGEVNFVGGIQVPANNNVTLSNTILANNTGGNVFNPWNIRNPVADGGGNIQWPRQRPNGQDDTPATATTVFVDPQLASAPANHGGFVLSVAIPPDSPAVAMGNPLRSDPVDARSRERLSPPDSGAYQAAIQGLRYDSFESP